jgi:hypothetical protein
MHDRRQLHGINNHCPEARGTDTRDALDLQSSRIGVATLVNAEQDAGFKSVEWNGEGFVSGIYYYRFEAVTFSGVKKMVLMK